MQIDYIPKPLLVDSPAAAKMLSVSERTLWTLQASGALPVVRIGRCVRFSVDDLREYINTQKKGGRP